MRRGGRILLLIGFVLITGLFGVASIRADGWTLVWQHDRRHESVWARSDIACQPAHYPCQPNITVTPMDAGVFCVPSTRTTLYCEVTIMGEFRYVEIDGHLFEDRRTRLYMPLVAP